MNNAPEAVGIRATEGQFRGAKIPKPIPLEWGDMNKLPLKAKFFTKVSYAKTEPRIAVAPVDMPNYEEAIAIGENPASDLEGNITLADETGEIMGIGVKQFGFESSISIAAAYERLQATYGVEFEEFLTAATYAAIEQRWSEFPMCFPVPKPVNQS